MDRIARIAVTVVIVAGLLATTARADRNTPGRPKPAAPKPPAPAPAAQPAATPEPATAPAKPAARAKTPSAAATRPAPATKAAPEHATGDKVQRDGVAVMSGPGSFFARLGDLSRGTRVEVVGDHGAWLEVHAASLSGFIPRTALESRQPGSASLGGAFGSSKPSVSSETAAVKGFNEDVERAHARERGQDWAGLDWIDRQTVTLEQVRAFLAMRGLSPEARP